MFKKKITLKKLAFGALEEHIEAKVAMMLNNTLEQATKYIQKIAKKGDKATVEEIAVMSRLIEVLNIQQLSEPEKKPEKQKRHTGQEL